MAYVLSIAILGALTVMSIVSVESSGSFCLDKTDGNYANPTNCSTYIACAGLRSYIRPCPPTLHYNATIDQCDYPEKVDCKDDFCVGKPNGNYRDQADCSRYISCTDGVASSRPCLSGLYYDVIRDRCDYPRNVNCSVIERPATTPAPSPPTTPTLAPPLPVSCDSNPPGTYADPTNCSRFVVCTAKGQGVLKSCASKVLNFHPVYKVCVWAYTYTCEGPNFCKGKPDGDYVDVNNCHGFISCTGSLTHRLACSPAHLNFNGTHCVHPNEFACTTLV